ncbi:MAG TPA: hypothetical protein VIM84_12730 [Gemmatimonadales bacterium]
MPAGRLVQRCVDCYREHRKAEDRRRDKFWCTRCGKRQRAKSSCYCNQCGTMRWKLWKKAKDGDLVARMAHPFKERKKRQKES